MKEIKIYVAGPFSKPEEKEALNHMIDLLKRGLPECESHGLKVELYIPMEFKVEGDFQKEDGTWNLPNAEWAHRVYDNDIKELNECDILVCMYVGHRSTTGTAFEIGYAKASNKTVVGYIPEYVKNEDMSLMVLNSFDQVLLEDGKFYIFTQEMRNQYNQK